LFRVIRLADSLRIAVDITHPAHFHFFKNSILAWQERGHDVLILSRDKDLTLRLLDEIGWKHHCLSKVRRGTKGMALELVEHGSGVWRVIGKHHSQVIAAIGGTLMVHAARLRGIPALVFYDTEHAKLSNRITYPFATRIFTPRAYRDDLGPRQVRYNGYHELAYLNPKYFTPDPAKLAVEGLEPGEPFTFLRLVGWTSHHDVHGRGVTKLYEAVEMFKKYGRVLISSEGNLPNDLKPYERKGRASDVHHILAYTRLLFGDSGTMASEAAVLGAPAIFLSTLTLGYLEEQERRYQMVFNFHDEAQALKCAEDIVSNADSVNLFRQRHDTMMSEQIDVAAFVTEQVERFARGEAR
jgi:uncharacterized protein